MNNAHKTYGNMITKTLDTETEFYKDSEFHRNSKVIKTIKLFGITIYNNRHYYKSLMSDKTRNIADNKSIGFNANKG